MFYLIRDRLPRAGCGLKETIFFIFISLHLVSDFKSCQTKISECLVCVCQIEQLHEAIEELFYFEFILDDIPIWGFVGYIEESGFLPHSHKVGLFVLLRVCVIYGGNCIVSGCQIVS